MLMRQEMHNRDELLDTVWHKNVPLKMSICAWRLLGNKWPTNDNLVRRGIIPIDAQPCVCVCGNNESAYHLLIHCPIFVYFGNMSKLGLVFIEWKPNIFWIILLSSLIPREALNPVGRFCILSGYAVFMCFGMKGITYCSLRKLNLLCSFWKESILLLYIGWKLKICVFVLVTMWWQQPLVCLSIGWLFFVCNYSGYCVDFCSALLCTSCARE